MKREEIAIDFREAAEHFDSISTVYKCTAAIPIKKKFLESATQVEQMRCETCKHRLSLTCENEKSVGFMNLVEPDNGCFNQELR